MFEKASREQLRFKLSTGVVSLEDLWVLKLEDLDKLAKSLNKELKEAEEESFIKTRTQSNKLLDLRFELVKHIINVRLQEAEDKKLRAEKSARRAKIEDLIAKKQDQDLEGKSVAELLKELEAL